MSIMASTPSVDSSLAQKNAVQNIILQVEAKARAEREAAAEAAEAEAKAAKEKAERIARRKARLERKKAAATMTEEEKAKNKEKRLMKLVGAVVVKCMSKYAKGISRDNFKKYAKELTQIIAEKEKKSSCYQESRLEALSEEKQAKIKKFSKDYIAKVLRKLEKHGHSVSSNGNGKHESSSSSRHAYGHPDGLNGRANATASSSTHTNTPSSTDGHTNGDVSMMSVDGGEMTMSVEEAMGFDPDSGSEDDDDDDEPHRETGATPQMDGLEVGFPPPPPTTASSVGSIDGHLEMQEVMSWESVDPRKRSTVDGVVSR